MESLQKGLHGINKKIPKVVLSRDFLSFSLQTLSLFICMFSVFAWAVFGFDSTIDGAIRIMEGKAVIEMGNGTHWSTVLNYFLIAFLISNYLSSKEVLGFHNIIASLFTPVVGMMVFEFPWVILTDIFHNYAIEGYWAITLYGLPWIDVGILILGLFLIPMSIFYVTLQLSLRKILLSPKVSLQIGVLSFACSFMIILVTCFTFGTPSVLIRNTFGLFFFVFVHAAIIDATENYTVPEIRGKYRTSQRKKLPIVIFVLSIITFLAWVFWPHFELVKGNLWPQTVYAFYESGALVETVWVENHAIHTMNILSKALVTAAVALAVIPKIVVRRK